MKRFFTIISISLLAVFLLSACQEDGEADTATNKDGKLQVVTSFTIIEDMVKEIGGDSVEVYNLVPIGTDPHEYEPLPDDIKAATDADVLFYNGLNLEGGKSGWFAKMVESVGQKEERVFEVSKGIEPMYLTSEDGKEEEINPHAFIDPVAGIQMAENVRDALIEVDPDNEATYEDRATTYIETLEAIDQEYQEKIEKIPEENRILVTSERAFQYMADRYGLKEGYIWALDTEENGSPEQITSLIEFIEEEKPPVLFLETNVDPRPLETVAKETGVEIFSGIFSDEIGKPGEEGDTYVKYLQYNIDKIYQGLTSK